MQPPEQSSIFSLLGVDSRGRWPEIYDTENGDFMYVFDQPEWLSEELLVTMLTEVNVIRNEFNIPPQKLPIHFIIADRINSTQKPEFQEPTSPVQFCYIAESDTFMVMIYPNDLEAISHDPIELQLVTFLWDEIVHACQVWQAAPTERVAYMEGIDSL